MSEPQIIPLHFFLKDIDIHGKHHIYKSRAVGKNQKRKELLKMIEKKRKEQKDV